MLAGDRAEGPVLALRAPLSFWGGVDPRTGRIIDAHHPDCGQSLAGQVVVMTGPRGSCGGSSVLADMALCGSAPAALILPEAEGVLALGAMVADAMFGLPVAVAVIPDAGFDAVAAATHVRMGEGRLETGDLSLSLSRAWGEPLDLSGEERGMLAGDDGPAVALAMNMICRIGVALGARRLIPVSRAHIDACLMTHRSNLAFAERMLDLGARVRIPTTVNAISVDRQNWRRQGVAASFGASASRLADAFVDMGAAPTFTCAPYLLDDVPLAGEAVGWSESNAVIYANSVLGARTAKHPDYMDLFIALTGRVPEVGVYLDQDRAPRIGIDIAVPQGADETLWPLLGWLAGEMAPDAVPLLTGLQSVPATPGDLKALCAAFGTTSAAPLLHVAGHTPEAGQWPAPDRQVRIGKAELLRAWTAFNKGGETVDLVAVGSPHASLEECRMLANLLEGRRCHPEVSTIVTLGRDVLRAARDEGVLARLETVGVRLIPDLCWCSITEPVLPPGQGTVMTNSGKYAHYATGLTGRPVRFGPLRDCAEAAVTGCVPKGPPGWLSR